MSEVSFELAVACCRHCFRDRSATALALPSDIDWQRFLETVRLHRVQGLAWNALSRSRTAMPDEVARALEHAAFEVAAQNLRAAAQARRLAEQFAAARIPLIFLKGATAGALAYSDPALKAAIDVDLLIDPNDLSRAADLLDRCGFKLVLPRCGTRAPALMRWHRSHKESVWVSDAPPLQIDLHTRTADNRRLIGGITVHSPAQEVDIGNGIRLATLATPELFAYLAVHGASSAWFRLKWISDFAGLVHAQQNGAVEPLYRRAQELGAGRAAGQALLLADTLFGTLDDYRYLRRELTEDRATRLLHRTALNQLAATREPTKHRFGTLAIHWTQLLLKPGLSFSATELAGQARRAVGR